MSTVRFERPPVDHVHLTITFDIEEELHVSHLSGLREAWKGDYPTTRERPPVGQGDAVRFVGAKAAWPFPYLVFRAEDRAIIIESGQLALTWTFNEEGANYPTYEVLRAELEQRFAEFTHVVTEELGVPPNVTGSQCLYTNALPGEDIRRAIVGTLTRWEVDIAPSESQQEVIYQGFRTTWAPTEQTQMTRVQVGIDPLSHGDYESGAELLIDTTRELQEGEELPLGGIDIAHEVLIETFLAVTRPDQQEAWGRSDAN